MAPLPGAAPSDPAFLQWPNGLKSKYTKLKTNQTIILGNIFILEATETFLSFFVGPTSVNVNKIVLEYTVYSIKKKT